MGSQWQHWVRLPSSLHGPQRESNVQVGLGAQYSSLESPRPQGVALAVQPQNLCEGAPCEWKGPSAGFYEELSCHSAVGRRAYSASAHRPSS